MNFTARLCVAALPLSFVSVFLAQAPAVLAQAPAVLAQAPAAAVAAAAPHRNVILFVADGLRRGSVTAEDMPTLYRIRSEGVDLQNSHSVFPTFTTANASVIATGHGLGDTGDFSNVIYPGAYLVQPGKPAASGVVTPFLEADDVLATLNSLYDGNYLGETTLLEAAHDAGYSVAAVGKLGPTSIQLAASLNRDELGLMKIPDVLIVDDATGHANSVPLPLDFQTKLNESGLPTEAPLRTNGFGDTSQWSNGFSGDAAVAGTRAANVGQEQWFSDITTQLILPDFAAANKPFVILFWSRDPDGTQHNQGDSLQLLSPGINGETVRQSLRNADHCLGELVEWLHKHPAIEANTDILVTSDHGFATISRRELDADSTTAGEPSANLTYEPSGKDKPEPATTLPSGFLGIDLALYTHNRLFDPAVRATGGDSVYAEVGLSGEVSHYPVTGSALLGERITRLDGSDARLILAANGGSDLIYVPTHDPAIVKSTLEVLANFDYVGGLFVDDAYCPTATSCPGALPLSSIGLKGSTKLPTPAIVVTYKVFYLKPGDLQTAIQISDTTLQEGQGMHGGFGRDSTWNNMAAMGPDFKKGFVDREPVGNIDIVPTVASILGLQMATRGSLKGRIMTEALASSKTTSSVAAGKTLVSAATSSGRRTVLDYQEQDGVAYYDRACMTRSAADKAVCPDR